MVPWLYRLCSELNGVCIKISRIVTACARLVFQSLLRGGEFVPPSRHAESRGLIPRQRGHRVSIPYSLWRVPLTISRLHVGLSIGAGVCRRELRPRFLSRAAHISVGSLTRIQYVSRTCGQIALIQQVPWNPRELPCGDIKIFLRYYTSRDKFLQNDTC